MYMYMYNNVLFCRNNFVADNHGLCMSMVSIKYKLTRYMLSLLLLLCRRRAVTRTEKGATRTAAAAAAARGGRGREEEEEGSGGPAGQRERATAANTTKVSALVLCVIQFVRNIFNTIFFSRENFVTRNILKLRYMYMRIIYIVML